MPVLWRLGDSGNVTDGEVICDFLDAPETMFMYTTHKYVKSDMYQLEFGTHPRQRAFPEGNYN